MSEARSNLLMGTGETVDNDAYGVVKYKLVEPLVVGREYTVSAYVEELVRTPLPSWFDRPRLGLYDGAAQLNNGYLSGDVPGVQTLTFAYKQPNPDHADPSAIWLFNTPPNGTGVTRRARVRDVMLVEGDTPAAWAPAEGETLAGGGALMSANLLDGLTPELKNGTSAESDGTWHHAARTNADGHDDWLMWDLPDQAALETNQTYHVGLSVRGASANDTSLRAIIGYKDAAGSINYVKSSGLAIGTSWGRVEGTIVVPSGMKPFALYVAAYGVCPETWVASPTFSLGSPVSLAVASHTPYATEGHLEAVYATQASLQVQSDRITSEVSARAQTDQNVSDLSTRVTQTESGIQTEITNRTAAVNQAKSDAISSANANTSDALKSYTKTEDLGATDAVKDAKKAGTDAQATANATATLIRQYADGVLVAKTGANVGALVNADGSFDVVTLTWSNGVPSVSGTAASMDANSVSLLAGQIALGMHQSNQSNMLELRTKTTLPIIINRGLSVKEPETAGDYASGYVTSIYPVTAHNGITIDGGALTLPKPTWTVGRAVEDKCRAVYCVHGGTVFMSVNTADDWWSIDGWVNVGPSLFSDVTHDQTTGVPPSLRPAERIYFPAATYSGDVLKGYVGTDGGIWLYHSGSVANWSFSVSWPVGGA